MKLNATLVIMGTRPNACVSACHIILFDGSTFAVSLVGPLLQMTKLSKWCCIGGSVSRSRGSGTLCRQFNQLIGGDDGWLRHMITCNLLPGHASWNIIANGQLNQGRSRPAVHQRRPRQFPASHVYGVIGPPTGTGMPNLEMTKLPELLVGREFEFPIHIP